jgi:molybdopterin synthase catalytic subunit
MVFEVLDKPIDEKSMRTALNNPSAGAVVTFEGCVRDHNEGRQVQSLEYEVYVEMAEKEGVRILEEARERFGVLDLRAAHRMGPLEIGDIAVWVGVASAHRAEAFDACRYVIDALKHRLPIWKKEQYTDGSSEWVNCQRCQAEVHSP